MPTGKSWGAVLGPLSQSYTINQAVQAFGGKGAMVAAFAGTSDRKSTAYQTAVRNINRYQAAQHPTYGPLREGEKGKQARNIGRAGQAKLDRAVRAQQRKDTPLPHINLNGTIAINGHGSKYEREREIDHDITWDSLDAIAEAYAEDGETGADAAFAEWYGPEVFSFEMLDGGDYSLDY